MGGDKVFEDKVLTSLRKDFKVGSEDKNDVMFVGQRIKWKTHDKYGPYISVDQKLAVDAVEEVKIDKTLKDNVQCTPQLHTAYRSVLGQLNWLQSRTQVHLCYKFSRCASAASSPTIGDVREINKVVRTLKSQYVDGRFWPLKGQQRILGMPDASYRNNSDKSSQRAHVIFLAEDRKIPSKTSYRSSGYDKKPDASTRGSITDYESHKITTTTQSTTVAELNALMKCFGTCLFLRALWADGSGEVLSIYIRTDANNLVTTAQTTHLPEQKETHHLIQMLRHESNSGHLDDLSHIASEYCLADPLTKHTAKPDQLVQSITTGGLRKLAAVPDRRYCGPGENVTNADCMILISLSYGKQSQISLSRSASEKAAADGVFSSGYSDEVMLQDVERVKYLQNIDFGLKDSDTAAHSPLVVIAKLWCQRNLRVRTEQSDQRRRGRGRQRQPQQWQRDDEEEEEVEVEEEDDEPIGRLRSTTPSSGARYRGQEAAGQYENPNRRLQARPVTPPRTPPVPPP
eukprot:s2899_g1.t1